MQPEREGDDISRIDAAARFRGPLPFRKSAGRAAALLRHL